MEGCVLTHYDMAGCLGVALGIYAYARLQWRRDYAKELSYSSLNLVNAGLMLYSLSDKWNPSAALGTSLFGLISLYGVYRCLKYKWAAR